MAIAAAGMDPERQAVTLGGLVDRPVVAAPERHVAHRQQQHLDEARVGRAALDLLDGAGPGSGGVTTIEARSRGSGSSHSRPASR